MTTHPVTTRTAPDPPPPARPPVHRVLPPAREDLADHHRRLGPLPQLARGELVGLLQAAGLTGRGGAGFPTWRKIVGLLEATGGGSRRAVVVANAAEGEPASSKDAVLLATAPHLVLDGLALVAAAAGTRRTHLYAATHHHPGLRAALAERGGAGPALVTAPGTFVAGEESAVAAAVEGRRALPWDRTVPVVQRGVGGRPTLVHNVETLAHVALLARWGADWFRSQGSAADPGTRLVTLSGAVTLPGVVEVPGDVPLRAVLAAAGTDVASLRAVLVGGYHGSWVSGRALSGGRLSRESLSPVGAAPGAGVLVALDRRTCGLAVAARTAAWLAGQSAGQCGPCVNGLPATAAALDRLARGDRDPALPREVARLAGLASGRGSCRHPDGTARFVASTLGEFASDVEAHQHGWCEAGAR